jgi:hypothetical protein
MAYSSLSTENVPTINNIKNNLFKKILIFIYI